MKKNPLIVKSLDSLKEAKRQKSYGIMDETIMAVNYCNILIINIWVIVIVDHFHEKYSKWLTSVH